jgi:hypothetical protein
MALRIPNRYIAALNDIRNLPESAIDELFRALETSSLTASSDELEVQIADSVPSIPKEELHRIIDVTYSLYHVREFSEVSKSGFLNELIDGIREQAKPKILDKDVSGLRERFKRLLSLKPLESISKALSLQRDNERLFCGSKIVSDIRPVFGEDVKSAPLAATILHTLKLSYHENGDHKEFFIVLDEVDLDALQSTIKRAKSKADTLNRLLGESKLPRLGV